MHEYVWNSESSDYSGLPNDLPKDKKAEHLAKVTEKGKILGNLMDKEVLKLDDHCCPEVQEIIDPQAGREMLTCSSY